MVIPVFKKPILRTLSDVRDMQFEKHIKLKRHDVNNNNSSLKKERERRERKKETTVDAREAKGVIRNFRRGILNKFNIQSPIHLLF